MTGRFRAPDTMVAALLALVLVAAPSTAQDWRAAGVAAFDAAWLTVNNTFYDPDFGGLDWDAVRAELRPRVEVAASADDQRAIIRDMLGRLGTSHFALLSSSPTTDDLRGPASVPFDVRVVESTVLVTRLHDPAAGSIRLGDRILRIDDRDAATLVATVDANDPRYRQLAWRRVARELSGAEGERVRLLVQSPDAESDAREVHVSRLIGPGEMVTVGNLPALRAHLEAHERLTPAGHRVGVIRFNIWMAAVAEPFAAAVDRFRGHDGLVIDLRGNPGGLADMIRGIAGHVLSEPAVLGRMRMRGLDLEFRANPRRSTSDGRAVTPFAGPVALLVDGLTASASECFAGALQSLGRVRVFGTRTSGQALPASTQQLANGDVLLYVVGDFVTSTGRRLEGTGVVPDVEVPVDAAALAAGHDALRAALTWIDAQPAPAVEGP